MIMFACICTLSMVKVRAQEIGTVVRAAYTDLAPYGFELDGKPAGFVPDTFKAVANETGLGFRFLFSTSKRALYLIEKGDADIVMFFRVPRLDPFVIPLVQYNVSTNIVVGLKGTDVSILDDLKRLKVAVLRGGLFEPDFAANPDWDYVSTNDYVHSVNLLLSGRVDALIGATEGLLYNFQKAGIRAEDLGKWLVYSRGEVWVQLSKASPLANNHARLKAGLEKLARSDMNTVFRRRYLDEDMVTMLDQVQKTNLAQRE